MKLGKILKRLMVETKTTQETLAQSINVSQRAVSKWVNLQSEPTETAIYNIAKYFNVSADYLLGLEDEAGRKVYNINNDIHHNNVVNINQK